MSVAVENFVKAIYKNKRVDGLDTRPGSIAKKLNISNAAATDMARKLSQKGLLKYEKYKELELTKEGTMMALQILRKHRIWETFLFKLLDLSLHEIHREAELLEHQTSDFLAEKIHAYLDYPNFDPHGDPIPNASGEIVDVKSISLANAIESKDYIISRLQSDDKDFFDFCSSSGLKNGQLITVKKQFSKTQMTEVIVNDTKLLLGYNITSLIKIINEK